MNELDALYRELILDHSKHPQHVGLDAAAPGPGGVGESYQKNPVCGDEITLRVHLTGQGEDAVVADISYDNQGCSISQASASVMCRSSTASIAAPCSAARTSG